MCTDVCRPDDILGAHSQRVCCDEEIVGNARMGFTDEGAYLFDTTGPGNANTGHEYGTTLAAEQKRDLMEYLKTL